MFLAMRQTLQSTEILQSTIIIIASIRTSFLHRIQSTMIQAEGFLESSSWDIRAITGRNSVTLTEAAATS